MHLCISIQKGYFLMVSTTFLQGLKNMIITLGIKIIIIKPEMFELFQITQLELMDQYFRIHLISTFKRSKSINHLQNQYKKNLLCLFLNVFVWRFFHNFRFDDAVMAGSSREMVSRSCVDTVLEADLAGLIGLLPAPP